MIKLEEAVSRAQVFLGKSGIYGAILEEISMKENRWIVSLRVAVLGLPPSLQYYNIVEVDKENSEIVGFRKEKPGT